MEVDDNESLSIEADAGRSDPTADSDSSSGGLSDGEMAERRRSEKPKERQAAAEGLAVAALGFIAAEPERLGRFLALSGIGPDSIRTAAREP